MDVSIDLATAGKAAGADAPAAGTPQASGDGLAALFAEFVARMVPVEGGADEGVSTAGVSARKGRPGKVTAEEAAQGKADGDDRAADDGGTLVVPAWLAVWIGASTPVAGGSDQDVTDGAQDIPSGPVDGGAAAPVGDAPATGERAASSAKTQVQAGAAGAPVQEPTGGEQWLVATGLTSEATNEVATGAEGVVTGEQAAPTTAGTATDASSGAKSAAGPRGVTQAGRALARALADMTTKGTDVAQTSVPAQGPAAGTARPGGAVTGATPGEMAAPVQAAQAAAAAQTPPSGANGTTIDGGAGAVPAQEAGDVAQMLTTGPGARTKTAGPVEGAANEGGSRGTRGLLVSDGANLQPPAALAAVTSSAPVTDVQMAVAQTPSQDQQAAAQDVADQIVRAMRVQVRDGIGTARVQLRPEHLGEVQIDLTVSHDRVTAVVHAERADVRAQIEGQGAALRSGLSTVGLHLEELTVRDQSQSRERQQRRSDQSAGMRKRRSADPDKAFELVA